LHLKKKYLHILVLVGDLHFILSRNLLENIPNNVCHLTQLFIFISLSYARFPSFQRKMLLFFAVFMTTFCISQRKKSGK